MIIRSMHLENYRCFEKLDISFDEKLTVLVGANGSGKTAVLDALSIALDWAWSHRKSLGKNCIVPADDIAINRKHNEFTYRMDVRYGSDDNTETMRIALKSKILNHKQHLIILPEDCENIVQTLDNENPLFVAYMAGRYINEMDTRLEHNNLFSVYPAFENAFMRSIDFKTTVSWFNDADASEARAIRDNGKSHVLPELQAVREAISKALLEQYERPCMSGIPPEMVIYRKGTSEEYRISQLSDGYRAMLALVMDLARRMAQARNNQNNDNESILNTSAVVLIDEVELHLHPSWQQTVLTTLMEIFPNTQFIVTTHSPQVLTSIPPKHIRILSDGEAYTYNEQTQGAEASRLLKRVFGVEQRPNGLEIVQILNRYTNLVYNEEWDTPEAIEMRGKLINHYGNDDPELVQLDLHIENKKWESGL